MLKKIEGQYGRSEKVRAFVDEANRMVARYGWEKRTTCPWGFAEPVTKTIREISWYDESTSGSKDMIITLANGLADIMNAWERHEQEPKVSVRVIKTGKVKAVSREFAEMLVEDGDAVFA